MRIGIIAGSGFYRMEGIKIKEEIFPDTPWGKPSSPIVIGELGGKEIAFLSRHGDGHVIMPTDIPYRANVFALKVLGVKKLISVSAVGSLREHITPGDFVVPDQIIDFTKKRAYTFFEKGLVAHVSMAEPFCLELRRLLIESTVKVKGDVCKNGTYVCVEGPQFSSKAESNLFRHWGADVIGMTNMPECKLAREAEMCYATLALVTDYDCWHEEEEKVTVEMILEVMAKNVNTAKDVLKEVIKCIKDDDCICQSALKDVFVTHPQKADSEVVKKLEPIIGKYFKK